MPDPSRRRTSAHTSTSPVDRVGPGFLVRYALAFTGTCLVLIAPLLVTLALHVNSLVGTEAAPNALSLITGAGALVAMLGNPLCGKLSDRTTWRIGMRRPWMLIGLTGGSLSVLVVALAPTVAVVLVGWCLAQLFFNALLAAQTAVLADQVPVAQRGLVSGVIGICLPIASVAATFVVNLFAGNQVAMFLAPCGIGGVFIVLFALTLDDRRRVSDDKPPWSLRELAGSFSVPASHNRDFTWAFASRFLFVLAYAFLVTYQPYFLLVELGTAEDDVPGQIFLGTLTSSTLVILASLISGRVSDRTGRRKVFVLLAAVGYGMALVVVAVADDFTGFLVGMALSGLGFGMYVAVDLALVVDVLPDVTNTAKDLGVFNIAGALPFTIGPALAPAVLAVGDGSYSVLYGVAGGCALLAAAAILPVRRVR